MKKLILLSAVFTTVIMLVGCENKNGEITQRSLLEKSWAHAYEEDISEEIEMYRPSDSNDFPLSRYRQVYNFEKSNACEYLVLAANDGHYMERGIWTYNEKSNIITIFNSGFEKLYEFEVVELTVNLLKLRPIN